MFSFTPLFKPSALPFSYSTPEAPPSPEIPSSFSRTSSSSSAIVFCLGFCSLGPVLVSGPEVTGDCAVPHVLHDPTFFSLLGCRAGGGLVSGAVDKACCFRPNCTRGVRRMFLGEVLMDRIAVRSLGSCRMCAVVQFVSDARGCGRWGDTFAVAPQKTKAKRFRSSDVMA